MMGKAIFIIIFLAFLILPSCNKDENEEDPIETCIEGWTEGPDGNNLYYEKCPQSLTNCVKTFRMYINVTGIWPDGPGSITVRNIEKGVVVEEISRELLLYRHREQIQMIHDKRYRFTHEVTLELPTERCTINGEFRRYTYYLDLPCDGYSDLVFDICADN